MPHTYHWIMTIIDRAFKQGLPNFWFSPHEKEVNIKVGDMNQVSHYGTIMLSSTMGKLDSTIMEQKISALAENRNKGAIGQVGCRREHSLVDYLVNSRVTMDESRLQ